MALTSWPRCCPECGGTRFHEIGRIEANEFGPGEPPTDRAIYQCNDSDCREEWEQ